MKKKYQLNRYNQCVTLCKHRTLVIPARIRGVLSTSIDIYIGSEYCLNCEHNIKNRIINDKEKAVYCNYKESKRISEMSLTDIMAGVNEWQDKTFPNSTPLSCVSHLNKEVHELILEVSRRRQSGIEEELADCAILIMGLAGRCGIDLQFAIHKKMTVNRLRKWGQSDANGVIEHVKQGEQ